MSRCKKAAVKSTAMQNCGVVTVFYNPDMWSGIWHPQVACVSVLWGGGGGKGKVGGKKGTGERGRSSL